MTSVIAGWEPSSKELDKLMTAQSKALGQMRNAPRSSKSHFGMYADLATVMDTIRKPLADNELSVTQCFVPYDDQTIYLVTTLGHSSGQFVRSFLPLKATLQPQQLAATATYLKRVELTAIVGCAADDDDDGQQATASHVAATLTDESRIEKALVAKIKSAKDKAGIVAVVAQAARGVEAGQLSMAAAERVSLVADDAIAKLPEPKPKREPVAAS